MHYFDFHNITLLRKTQYFFAFYVVINVKMIYIKLIMFYIVPHFDFSAFRKGNYRNIVYYLLLF